MRVCLSEHGPIKSEDGEKNEGEENTRRSARLHLVSFQRPECDTHMKVCICVYRVRFEKAGSALDVCHIISADGKKIKKKVCVNT